VCPEIKTLDNNAQVVLLRIDDKLTAGTLEDAPPITIIKKLELSDFAVIERAGERFLVVQLPTKVEAQTETAFWLIPPQRWSEFPNPVNGQST
jgi:hypothetical protein